MKGGRNLLWLLPLVVALSATLWWRPAARFLAPRGDFTAGPEHAEGIKTFGMEEVFFTQSRSGIEEFTLRADRVRTADGEEILEMEKVEARLRDNKGRQTVITGGEAFYDTAREILTLLDDVRVVTPEGYQLYTEALRCLTRYKKIKTAEVVRLTGSGMQVNGRSMFYDLVNGAFRVGGRVTVDMEN